jgi:glycine hydroxymethyltransferase
MSLDHGGHLTHGAKVNFSGKIFNAVQYGLDPATGDIDYAGVERLAPRAPAEADHRRLLGLLARGGLGALPRHRRRGRRVVHGRHGARGGPGRRGRLPEPVPHADVVTTTTHKTLRGPRGGLILARPHDELHKKFNSLIFPGTQGGPLMHVIAAKAVAFLEALQPDFAGYQRQVVANARPWPRRCRQRGYSIVSAAPTTTCSWST